MTRTIPAVLGAAALLIGSALGAQAMPLAPEPGAPSLIGKVAGGCGPGYFRDGWGYCRPMAYAPRPRYNPYAYPYYQTRPAYGYGRPYAPPPRSPYWGGPRW